MPLRLFKMHLAFARYYPNNKPQGRCYRPRKITVSVISMLVFHACRLSTSTSHTEKLRHHNYYKLPTCFRERRGLRLNFLVFTITASLMVEIEWIYMCIEWRSLELYYQSRTVQVGKTTLLNFSWCCCRCSWRQVGSVFAQLERGITHANHMLHFGPRRVLDGI